MLIDIVDDDDFVCLTHAKMINSAGWYARTFHSARAFLATLGRGEPSCVIIDVQMPDMNGSELIQQLVADGHNIPVVVVTAHADSPMADCARALGVYEILPKPVCRDELLEAVRIAAARRPRAAFRSARAPVKTQSARQAP